MMCAWGISEERMVFTCRGFWCCWNTLMYTDLLAGLNWDEFVVLHSRQSMCGFVVCGHGASIGLCPSPQWEKGWQCVLLKESIFGCHKAVDERNMSRALAVWYILSRMPERTWVSKGRLTILAKCHISLASFSIKSFDIRSNFNPLKGALRTSMMLSEFSPGGNMMRIAIDHEIHDVCATHSTSGWTLSES